MGMHSSTVPIRKCKAIASYPHASAHAHRLQGSPMLTSVLEIMCMALSHSDPPHNDLGWNTGVCHLQLHRPVLRCECSMVGDWITRRACCGRAICCPRRSGSGGVYCAKRGRTRQFCSDRRHKHPWPRDNLCSESRTSCAWCRVLCA